MQTTRDADADVDADADTDADKTVTATATAVTDATACIARHLLWSPSLASRSPALRVTRGLTPSGGKV